MRGSSRLPGASVRRSEVWPVERGVCEGKDNREVMEDIWGHALRSVLEIEQV